MVSINVRQILRKKVTRSVFINEISLSFSQLTIFDHMDFIANLVAFTGVTGETVGRNHFRFTNKFGKIYSFRV